MGQALVIRGPSRVWVARPRQETQWFRSSVGSAKPS